MTKIKTYNLEVNHVYFYVYSSYAFIVRLALYETFRRNTADSDLFFKTRAGDRRLPYESVTDAKWTFFLPEAPSICMLYGATGAKKCISLPTHGKPVCRFHMSLEDLSDLCMGILPALHSTLSNATASELKLDLGRLCWSLEYCSIITT